jgi:hypothetical protein
MGWTQDKGHTKTREQGEWCAKTYENAVVSMNAHVRCDLPVNDGVAARDVDARTFRPSASSMPANALRAFHEAVGERRPSDAPVVDANDVLDK